MRGTITPWPLILQALASNPIGGCVRTGIQLQFILYYTQKLQNQQKINSIVVIGFSQRLQWFRNDNNVTIGISDKTNNNSIWGQLTITSDGAYIEVVKVPAYELIKTIYYMRMTNWTFASRSDGGGE